MLLAQRGLLDDPLAAAAGIALSCMLGELSFRLVEQPSREWLSRAAQRTSAIVQSAVVLIMTGPLGFLLASGRLQHAPPAEVRVVLDEQRNVNPRFEECHATGGREVPGCRYGGARLGLILIGDSHAAAVARSVEKALPDPDLHVLDWTMVACPTIRGIQQSYGRYACPAFLETALRLNLELPAGVPMLIVNRYAHYFVGPNEPDRQHEVRVPLRYLGEPPEERDARFREQMQEGLIATACEFARTRPVFMLQPIPELGVHVPKTMARALARGRKVRVSVSSASHLKRNAHVLETLALAARRCRVRLLDPLPYLCPEGECYGDRDGLPIYRDDDHLSERGGQLLVPLFRQIFAAEAGSSRPASAKSSMERMAD